MKQNKTQVADRQRQPEKSQAQINYEQEKFKTMAIYISGAICGKMWMPSCKGGILLKKNARGVFGFYSKGASFREALDSLLMRDGGDFQHARFTADTVLRIERRSVKAPMKYTVHVWEREISQLPDCDDLVDSMAYVSDFMGED